MSHLRDRLTLGLAGVCLLALSVGLGGCGRKGPLEAPTSAAVVEPAPAATDSVADWQAQGGVAAAGQATARPGGRPHDAATRTAPAGTRRNVLDVLVD